MKSTIMMIAIMATLFITWTLISLIGWSLFDASLRECYINGATIFIMMVFGWIPSVIVACDLDKILD